jgi:hypothetical protein
MKKKIIIILTLFNDARALIRLLPKLYKKISSKDFELLIADDSYNKIKTRSILNNFHHKNIILIQRNKLSNYVEKCLATRKAMEYIYKKKWKDFEFITEIDSDGAQSPSDIKRGYNQALNQNIDLFIYSKYKKDSLVYNRDLNRILISKTITYICKKIFTNQISDYTNSFRIYNKKCLKILIKNKIMFTGAIQHIQNLLCLINNSIKIKEISCTYIEDQNRKSVVSYRELFKSSIDFLILVFRKKFTLTRY